MPPDQAQGATRVFVTQGLRIAMSDLPAAGLRLDWTGRSDGRNPAWTLAPFFDDQLQYAQDHGGVIELHFEKLEHFNSSTITALIQLIRKARSLRVRLSLFFDGKAKWQRLSFDALGVFEQADGLVHFEP